MAAALRGQAVIVRHFPAPRISDYLRITVGADRQLDRLLAALSCEQLHRGDVPPGLPHEPRIKTAVLADAAMTSTFTPESLAGIQIPLQVWRSELGGPGADATGTARVASSLPGKPDIHVIPAGHYGFLPPCSPQLAADLPRPCTDPPGFDRTAFHLDFDASIVGFFRQHLRDSEVR